MHERHEEARFHEFVVIHSSRLFRTALLIVGDYQLAQDLLQESLVKTYVAWPRLRDVGNAQAYTRRVIVTTSTSWRRRNSFHQRPAETLPEDVVADVADLIAADADLWSPSTRPAVAAAGRGRAALLPGLLRSPDLRVDGLHGRQRRARFAGAGQAARPDGRAARPAHLRTSRR